MQMSQMPEVNCRSGNAGFYETTPSRSCNAQWAVSQPILLNLHRTLVTQTVATALMAHAIPSRPALLDGFGRQTGNSEWPGKRNLGRSNYGQDEAW
jgi:hypothetical protein